MITYVSWRLIREHRRINVFILSSEIKCNCFKKIIMPLFELYAFLISPNTFFSSLQSVWSLILISLWINTLLINKVYIST